MSIFEQFRLDGKVAVITGGSRGIGAGIAMAYAEAGADIVLAARDLKQLNIAAESIRALGRKVVVVPTDVMKEEQLDGLAAAVLEAFGRVDILVNNAGGYPPIPFLDTTLKDFQRAFEFNVMTAFSLTKRMAPLIAKSTDSGAIINISSMAGSAPGSGFSAYGTAKAALTMLSKELAQEFAPRIRVNAIAVGATATEALNHVLTPEVKQQMIDTTPMGRLGEVKDIAACALYLASPASSYLTGDVINVNGGLVALNMELPRAFS